MLFMGCALKLFMIVEIKCSSGIDNLELFNILNIIVYNGKGD